MNLCLKPLFSIIVISFSVVTAGYSAYAQEQAEVQVFGDWQVACGDGEPCRMSQTVVQTSSRRLILQMRVLKSEEPTALLTFPLGILLSTGWQFQIDARQHTLLPFEICNTEGCHAGVRLTPNLLSAMKRGNNLSIKFLDASETTVNPVISLAGFTKAYEALQ